MKLIVGLGNPGPRYADTRHNVGWWVLATLDERAGGLRWKEKFAAELAETRIDAEKVALLRPLTFMNRSGQAVRQAVDFWRIEPEEVLVVLDDMNLELGRLRLRTGGSAGGHNGMASVIEHMGTTEVPRLRLGVGPAPEKDEHVSFVLSAFRPSERPVIDEAVVTAAEAAECWVRRGAETTMNRYNQ